MKPEEEKKISIVTICYNAVDVIEETILSVINQTYRNWEYIIIDGGSKDGTVDIIKKYAENVSYWISEPDRGIYDAMNKGIRVATGEWLNFMNAGDMFYDNCVLEKFVLQINPDTDIAYGDCLNFTDYFSVVSIPEPLDTLSKSMIFSHQATFVRTALQKEHLFDITFRIAGDYNFFYNAYLQNRSFQYIPIVVAKCESENGISSSNITVLKREIAVVRGVDKTLKWKIFFCRFYVLYKLKGIVKWIIPLKVVRKIQIRKMKRLSSKHSLSEF